MLGERIKEIIDFAKSESPYRSANKGWISNDVFLKLGTSDDKSSSQFDQFVKISFLWQPIIQLALTLVVVIFLSSIFAFAPISLSHGRIHNIVETFNIKKDLALIKKKVEVEKVVSKGPAIKKKVEVEKVVSKGPAIKKKVVTATDLFQPRHG